MWITYLWCYYIENNKCAAYDMILYVLYRLVSKRQTELAGSMMSVFMTAGLSIGSAVSLSLVLAIKNL